MTQFAAPSSYAIRLKVARVCYIIGSLYFMALDKLILFMAAGGEDLLRYRSSRTLHSIITVLHNLLVLQKGPSEGS